LVKINFFALYVSFFDIIDKKSFIIFLNIGYKTKTSMSAGGVFKLIANDGKADRMIMATELLNQRIKDIMCMRTAQNPKDDPTPSLVDIERTHILFVNSHFKPFAAIAYEYGKVSSQSGSAVFNGDVQFSIPQLGDFFNDMVVNAKLSAVSATSWVAGSIPAYPAAIGSTIISPQQSATDDTVNGIYKRYTYQYVTADGTPVDRSTFVGKNHVRYCEYPGQRLLQNVRFDVNGNPLDEYNFEVTNMHQKFKVCPGKLTGWKRLVGQEVPVEAYSDLSTMAGASLFPADHTGLVLAGGTTPAPVAPRNATLSSRRLEHVVYGPQTPKETQPALDMWIPLLFW
jgi:hypothetical protein